MPTSLALPLNQTRSDLTFDFRFWLLLAFPLMSLAAVILLTLDGYGGGVSSAFLDIAAMGI